MQSEQPQTILLVDDVPENLTALENLLEAPGREFKKAYSGKDALKQGLNHDIDLIILDVQMPGMDGFEVAEVLKSSEKTKRIPIIFVTAASKKYEHVMKGYAEGAVDYLIKPLDPEITRSKVNALLSLLSERKQSVSEVAEDYIFVKSGSKFMKINFSDVRFFEAEGDYVLIHLPERKHLVHTTMKSLEDKLPAGKFMRVHRSYIVNLEKVTSIHDYVIAIDGKTLSIGKSYQQKVINQLHRL